MKIQDVFEIAFHKATQYVDAGLLVLDENDTPTKLLTDYKTKLVNHKPTMESFMIGGRRGLILPESYLGRHIVLIERVPGNRNSVIAYLRFMDTHARTLGYDNRQFVSVPLSYGNHKPSVAQNRNLERVMTHLRRFTYNQ